MRKLLAASIFFIVALPSIAATKVTVEQLQALLADLHQQNRSDEATANRLKEVTLTEQLTPTTITSLAQYKPGPLTSTEIRILAAESATLLPPPSDLPSDPAPDRNAQTAIVNRAIDYVLHVNYALPRLSAQKETTRFQNGSDPIAMNSGTFSNVASANPGNNSAGKPYLEMLGSHTTTAQSERGVELPPATKKKSDPTSQNGQISQGSGGLVLGFILQDAAKHDLTFTRWQLINGKKIAVFSFKVDQPDSHYKINYCCFPVIENIGGAGAINASPVVPSMMAQPGGTAVTYKPFTTTPGYHGEFFIDPDTGVIVRLITSAELKPTDIVHHEDIREDYSPVNVAGKQLIVPVSIVTLIELSPNGEAFVKYTTRRTIFDVTYKEYIFADVPKAK